MAVAGDFLIPAIGSPVTVSLDTSEWMVVGQIVSFGGPATFRVSSIPNTTSATLVFLGYSGDLAPGVTISAGTQVSPSGTQPALSTYEAIADGTAYNLLSTGFALIDFTGGGSVDPSLTLPGTGKFILFASARVGVTGATNGGAPLTTVGIRLQRTNNTPGTLPSYKTITPSFTSPTNAEAYRDTPVMTASTDPDAYDIIMQPVVYETNTSGDVIELWANASAAPGGTLQITQAAIVAVKLS